MTTTVIKERRYRYRGIVPLCPYCLQEPSSGWKNHGKLGCAMCQNGADVYIVANFAVEEER